MWKNDTAVKPSGESGAQSESEARIDIGSLLPASGSTDAFYDLGYSNNVEYEDRLKPWDDPSLTEPSPKKPSGDRFQLLSAAGANTQTVSFNGDSATVSAGVSYLLRRGGKTFRRSNAVAFTYQGATPEAVQFIQCYESHFFKNALSEAARGDGEIEFDPEPLDGCHPIYERGGDYCRYMDDPEPLRGSFDLYFKPASGRVCLTQEITLTVWVIVSNVPTARLTVTFPYVADTETARNGEITIAKGTLTAVTAAAVAKTDLATWLNNDDLIGMSTIRQAFKPGGRYEAIGLTGLND